MFFRQERVGKGGKVFKTWKFRTMVVGAVKRGLGYNVARDDPRITKVGRFLRSWGLDELPQLFNVVKGEMSLVGPRPEWDRFVEKMAREIPLFNKRHLVRPGMAGWAQVEFKHTTDVEEYKRKLRYDLYYIKHMSPSLDIKALLRTLWVVITGRGAR